MKSIVLILTLAFAPFGLFAQISCEDGVAGDCKNLADSIIDLSTVHQSKEIAHEIYRSQVSAHFSGFAVDSLMRKYPNSVARIYITLPDANEFPQLLLVAVDTSTCDDIASDVILSDTLHSARTNIHPFDSKTTGFAIDNWKKVFETGGQFSDYEPIYGYNYPWEVIFLAISSSENNGNSEGVGFNTNNLCVKMGSVTCSETGEKRIDLFLTYSYSDLERPESDRTFYDFSKPCPQLCGTTVGGGSGGK